MSSLRWPGFAKRATELSSMWLESTSVRDGDHHVTGVAAGAGMVGPVGLEPTTKGFTRSAVSGGSGLSLHPRATRPVGCGTLEPVIKSAFESGRSLRFRALR